MLANIFNIQKFSIHDGPGIRTVVFFKGCPLTCLWCSNPESQQQYRQLLWDKDKCYHCRTCEMLCPQKNIYFDKNLSFSYKSKLCQTCTACADNCPHGALSKVGQFKSIDSIMAEVLQDKPFYEESGGGLTLSGGEVLMQPEAAAALLKSAKENNLHTALETTGYASKTVFKQTIINADLLLFDIKHYDRQKHKKYTGVYNDIILLNLAYAITLQKEIIIRIPVIPSVNNKIADAVKFSHLLASLDIKDINLLPFHQFGQKKYEQLNRPYNFKNTKELHSENLTQYAKVFQQNGFNVTL
ncbi:glycyl-radical enzyme activating protein [Pectinatus frisingensis]|uniref:glycyl-radical enzyme activating protein n=1 Tax=Pectinatus frisingensis TaxID=865 RepID=UPI0018C82FAC|nr:glycyl-radical enzyme activating protein [Pectinatus frisingensis]